MLVKRHMHGALGFAAVAALAGAGFAAHAAELQVTATLPDSCTVGGATLAFGEVNPTSGSPQADTTFNVQCSTSGTVSIALDGGLHHGDGNNGRAMKRTTSDDYLNYDLYQTAGGGAQPWPADEAGVGFGVSKSVNAGPNPIAVFGVIAGNQTKPGGEYSDTVQITMTVN